MKYKVGSLIRIKNIKTPSEALDLARTALRFGTVDALPVIESLLATLERDAKGPQ